MGQGAGAARRVGLTRRRSGVDEANDEAEVRALMEAEISNVADGCVRGSVGLVEKECIAGP